MKRELKKFKMPFNQSFKSSGLLAVLTVVALWSGGCANSHRASVLSPDDSRQIKSQIVNDLEAYNKNRTSLKGIVKFRFSARGKNKDVSMVFLLKKPESLKLEGLTDLGPSFFSLWMNEGMVYIEWPNEDREPFQGLATKSTLEEYLSVSLDPTELVDTFLGIVPLEDESAYELKRYKPRKKDMIAEQYEIKGMRTKLVVKKENGHYVPVQVMRIDLDGRNESQIAYDEFKEISGTLVPQSITARFWDPSLKVSAMLESVDLNSKIDKSHFKLPKDPSSFMVVPSDAFK